MKLRSRLHLVARCQSIVLAHAWCDTCHVFAVLTHAKFALLVRRSPRALRDVHSLSNPHRLLDLSSVHLRADLFKDILNIYTFEHVTVSAIGGRYVDCMVAEMVAWSLWLRAHFVVRIFVSQLLLVTV